MHWHLDRLGAETKVVLVAHNMHIQKTPVRHDGRFSALPMGYYLARELGEQYLAVALTHTGNTVPEMDVAAGGSAVGFTVTDTELQPPAPGSVEAELVRAGLGEMTTLTDVRGLPSPDTPHPRAVSHHRRANARRLRRGPEYPYGHDGSHAALLNHAPRHTSVAYGYQGQADAIVPASQSGTITV